MEKREITLVDIFAITVKWLWVLVIGMITVGAVAFYYGKFCVTPMYASSSRFLVQSRTVYNQQSSPNLLEEQRAVALSQMVVTEYIEILNTGYFANELLAYVEGKTNPDDTPEKIAAIKAVGTVEGNYDSKTLKNMISFETKEASAAFSVKVEGPNSKDVYVIAKYVELIMEDYLKMKNPGAGQISVIDGALEAKAPYNNKVVLFTLIGIIVGAALSFAIVYVIDINDTRVKDEKELLQVFALPVIGSIPDCTSTSSSLTYLNHTQSKV